MKEEEVLDENLLENEAPLLETETKSEETVSDVQDGSVSDTTVSESSDLIEMGETLTSSETDKVFTQEEMEQIITSVLASQKEFDTQQTEESVESVETVVEEIPRTLFNTQLEDYSVSESLLVCILLVLVVGLIDRIFKGSHWFGKL